MYQKSSEGWIKHIDFITWDLLCIQIAFFLSYGLRQGSWNPYVVPLYCSMAIFVELADIILIFFFESYKNVLKRGYYLEFVSAIKQAVILVLVSSLYLFTIKAGNGFSRIILFLMGGIYVILTYVVRIIWKQYLKNRMKAGGGDRSLIVIATSKNAEEIIQNIIEKNYEMFRISGIIIWDKDMLGKSIDGIPVVANIENAAQFLCQEWVDEVLINLDEMYPYLLELIEQCKEMGITLHLNLEKIGACIGGKQIVEEIGGYTVLTTSINTMTMKQAFIKRTSDIFFGMAGCIATGLIAVFIGPIIYISSPGPIFFSQERVGKNGKRFKLYKFRSMYMDAEERKAELMKDNKLGDGKMFKLDFDPRVIGNKVLPDGTHKTGIGDFIRRTSLDEFPQFYNVLKGDMSLIGTRPPLISETNLYELHHRQRLAIRPGITGMWQVSGRSDITDFEEVVKLDTEYIKNWSIGLDLKIILKTVKVMLKKNGSM